MVNRTVLIADDDPAFLRVLKRQCQELALEVQTAADGLEALMLVVRNAPDLLILDINMPGTDGLSLCERLGQDQQTRSIPVIVLTGKSDEETIRRCNSLGAHYVHKGLQIWDELRPIMCDLLGLKPEAAGPAKADEEEGTRSPATSSSPKILVIDDDPQITLALMIRLQALGIEVMRSPNAKVGHLLAKEEKPDLIITDYNMPEISGEQLLVKLKGNAETADIPVIVLTGQTIGGKDDLALKREMLGRRGAVAYLTKPLDFDRLLEELRRYINLSHEARPVRRANRLVGHS